MLHWPDLIFPPINLYNAPYQCIAVKSEKRITSSLPMKHVSFNQGLLYSLMNTHGGNKIPITERVSGQFTV